VQTLVVGMGTQSKWGWRLGRLAFVMPTTALPADECCHILLPMCRADDEAAADRAVLAATAATGLVKLLVAGAAEPDSGLEHGDMVKVATV
jgi:hypothetical protein